MQIQGFGDKHNPVSGSVTQRWEWKINRQPVRIITNVFLLNYQGIKLYTWSLKQDRWDKHLS